MEAGDALAAWLGSGERQQSTAQRAEEIRRWWTEKPAVRALAQAVAHGPQALVAAARWFIGQPGEVDELVEALVQASAADPFFRPPFRLIASEIHSGFLIFDTPELAVSLGTVSLEALAAKKVAGSGAGSVVFSGESGIVRFVRSGSARISFWEAPPAGAQFCLGAAGPCRLVGRRCVEDGDSFEVDGRRESFIIEHASTDLVLLQASFRSPDATVAMEYDARTRRAIGASSAHEANSRLEMMVSLLRLLGADEARPLVREALAGAAFHTRWCLMRELLAWDAEAALPSLRQMAETDPHPEVRFAACQALGLFFAPPFAGQELQPCPA